MYLPKSVQDVTIAAVADLHLSGRRDELPRMQRLFRDASLSADVLAICGDFTCHGRPDELRTLLSASRALTIPTVAVLGNHDHESDMHMELVEVLAMAGIHVLDGTPHKVHGIGFAGVKGFGGGFKRGAVHAFGERPLKQFVAATDREVMKLDRALSALETEITVALMHYAPVAETLEGEPKPLWSFLGSSRFESVIDRARANVVFHGHAHLGSPAGRTQRGAPVFNVARPCSPVRGCGFASGLSVAPKAPGPRCWTKWRLGKAHARLLRLLPDRQSTCADGSAPIGRASRIFLLCE